MSTDIVKDVNYEDIQKEQKKINYKELFIALQEGDNLLRFVDLHAKKIGTHWVDDAQGKKRSVKCPVTGCPCCIRNVPVQYKTFMKVVDKLGVLRVFEFGPQVDKQLKSKVKELKEEDSNATLTQRDIIIERGPKGSNPLYNVRLAKVNAKPTGFELMRQQAIQEAIEKDDIDLAQVVVPWTVERINKFIYGIADAETTTSTSGSVSNTIVSAPVSAPVVTEQEDEDLSMFDRK